MMDLKERGLARLIWLWIGTTVMNLWVPQNARKFLRSCTASDLCRRAQLRGVS
jgi:hypothetical protein